MNPVGEQFMPLVRVKQKFQVTLPAEVREELHIKEGDLWVFGNYCGRPQYLVFSLMREGFITFQVQPDPPKQVAQIFNPISAALEHLDFIVQSFDPTAR